MFYWLKKNESQLAENRLAAFVSLIQTDPLRRVLLLVIFCLSFAYMPQAVAQTPSTCPGVTVGEQPGFLGDTTPSLYSGCYYSVQVPYRAQQKTSVIEYFSLSNRYYGASAEGSSTSLYDSFTPSVTVDSRQSLMPITTDSGFSQMPMIVNMGSMEPSSCADEDYSMAADNVAQVTGDWYCARETSVITMPVYFKWQAGSAPFELSEITYVSAISVSPTNLSVDESSATATFTLSLGIEPSASVIVDLSSNNTDQGIVSPLSLTFTPSNWNTAQTVTVTAVDDDIVDGDQILNIVTAPAVSTDVNYNGLNADDVSVTNVDDDTAGIVISSVSGDTTEAGGTATYTVMLNSEPTADVTVDLNSNSTAEGTVNPPSLTFTSSNWDTEQTVTITGVDDNVVDGDQSFSILTAPGSSLDSHYNGLNADNVSVTNVDNDSVGIIIGDVVGDASEDGGSATFTLSLNSEPTADVTIGLSNNNTAEGILNPSSLTFTSSNWNTVQTVTVTGEDDAIVDGSQSLSIMTAPAISLDSHYNGLDGDDVSLSNADDDSVGIVVRTSESGNIATYRVKLNSEPTTDVIVFLSMSNAEGIVNQAILTFTSTNWNTEQIATFGYDLADGDLITNVFTSSADGNYNGLNTDNLLLTNIQVSSVNIIPIIEYLLSD